MKRILFIDTNSGVKTMQKENAALSNNGSGQLPIELPELQELITLYAALDTKNRARVLRIINIYLNEQKERRN